MKQLQKVIFCTLLLATLSIFAVISEINYFTFTCYHDTETGVSATYHKDKNTFTATIKEAPSSPCEGFEGENAKGIYEKLCQAYKSQSPEDKLQAQRLIEKQKTEKPQAAATTKPQISEKEFWESILTSFRPKPKKEDRKDDEDSSAAAQ